GAGAGGRVAAGAAVGAVDEADAGAARGVTAAGGAAARPPPQPTSRSPNSAAGPTRTRRLQAGEEAVMPGTVPERADTRRARRPTGPLRRSSGCRPRAPGTCAGWDRATRRK